MRPAPVPAKMLKRPPRITDDMIERGAAEMLGALYWERACRVTQNATRLKVRRILEAAMGEP